MIKDLKMVFQLTQYGVGYKMTIVTGSIILLIGIIVEFVTGGTNVIGPFYIAISATMPVQQLYNMTICESVISSPKYKEIMTKLHTSAITVLSLFMYTVIVIVHTLIALFNPANAIDVLTMMVFTAILLSLTIMFMTLLMKYYWVSMFILILTIVCAMQFILNGVMVGSAFALPIICYYLTGYGIILIGIAVESLICKGLYKKNLDPAATRNMLKRVGE